MLEYKKFNKKIEELNLKAQKIALDITIGYPELMNEAIGAKATCNYGVTIMW